MANSAIPIGGTGMERRRTFADAAAGAARSDAGRSAVVSRSSRPTPRERRSASRIPRPRTTANRAATTDHYLNQVAGEHMSAYLGSDSLAQHGADGSTQHAVSKAACV